MRLAVAVVGGVGREVVMKVRKQASERWREREREEREGASEHSLHSSAAPLLGS